MFGSLLHFQMDQQSQFSKLPFFLTNHLTKVHNHYLDFLGNLGCIHISPKLPENLFYFFVLPFPPKCNFLIEENANRPHLYVEISFVFLFCKFSALFSKPPLYAHCLKSFQRVLVHVCKTTGKAKARLGSGLFLGAIAWPSCRPGKGDSPCQQVSASTSAQPQNIDSCHTAQHSTRAPILDLTQMSKSNLILTQ